jgi:hypothetical protein
VVVAVLKAAVLEVLVAPAAEVRHLAAVRQ